MNRREFLVAAAPLLAAAPAVPMGVAATCYFARRWPDALAFLEHCHGLGAAGVQTGLRGADPQAFRAKAEEYGMWVEAFVSLPAGPGGVESFDQAIRQARECGASVARVAFLGGRRYETFDSLDAWRQFRDRAWTFLTLAEPIARKHRFHLAIENHKDWRIPDLLDLIKRLSSAYVGVLVDTGNSISLLEDPMAVVEAYAPYALATHIKDMGVQDYPDGFLLSEVPLGEGFLDLPRIFQTLKAARPQIRWSLEMITRDPLQVPCLTPKYWATMPDLPARTLADTLALARRNASRKPLPRVTGKTKEEQVSCEEENVRRCLAYARTV